MNQELDLNCKHPSQFILEKVNFDDSGHMETNDYCGVCGKDLFLELLKGQNHAS